MERHGPTCAFARELHHTRDSDTQSALLDLDILKAGLRKQMLKEVSQGGQEQNKL